MESVFRKNFDKTLQNQLMKKKMKDNFTKYLEDNYIQ